MLTKYLMHTVIVNDDDDSCPKKFTTKNAPAEIKDHTGEHTGEHKVPFFITIIYISPFAGVSIRECVSVYMYMLKDSL